MKKISGAGVATAALLALGLQGCDADDSDSTPRPVEAVRIFDPARFDEPRENPYYPLVPGTVTRLRGTDEGEEFLETVTITRDTKMIQGVRTTVVSDVVSRADGGLAEKTVDWYATDDDGNVWYFGEDTATYDDDGNIESRDGTWQAGVDGAVAGIIMPADPGPTDAYRQELYPGEAEDQAWIVARDERIEVPAGTFDQVVRSYEWNRLEPDVISLKFYAPGVGIVAERDVSGGDEKFELVSVSR